VCSTVGERGHRTVFESLPECQSGRWIQVGRLDINTSGLLLFTNDGDLAHDLMHPRTGVERAYMVRVHGLVGPEVLTRLTRSVDLEDGPARFTRIVSGSGGATNRWFEVVLSEGRNRIVRRLWASQGYDVTRLMRVRFGTMALPRDMPPGTWRLLSHDESVVLRKLAGRSPIAR
jgi:23S rRNA pseudouridine2605 synthase